MRVSIAESPAPSVTAGRIKCARPPAPDTGNHAKFDREDQYEQRAERKTRQ